MVEDVGGRLTVEEAEEEATEVLLGLGFRNANFFQIG